jgi:hypothetical protein
MSNEAFLFWFTGAERLFQRYRARSLTAEIAADGDVLRID